MHFNAYSIQMQCDSFKIIVYLEKKNKACGFISGGQSESGIRYFGI